MTTRVCTVEGCARPHSGRGYCNRHYHHFRRSADFVPLEPRPERFCSVSGCGRQHAAHGWCATHYARWRNTGDVRADVPVTPTLFGVSVPTLDARRFDLDDTEEL